jgi:hypothetical protein
MCGTGGFHVCCKETKQPEQVESEADYLKGPPPPSEFLNVWPTTTTTTTTPTPTIITTAQATTKSPLAAFVSSVPKYPVVSFYEAPPVHGAEMAK